MHKVFEIKFVELLTIGNLKILFKKDCLFLASLWVLQGFSYADLNFFELTGKSCKNLI